MGLASSTHPTDLEAIAAACEEVAERAAETLDWAKRARGPSLLDIALHHLTLGRAALYGALLDVEEGSSRGQDKRGRLPYVPVSTAVSGRSTRGNRSVGPAVGNCR